MPGDPADALAHPPSQLLLAHPLTAQLGQQPTLLQLGEAVRVALTAVQEQGVALVEVQERCPHRVRFQALEAAQTLETVDDQVRASLLHHHDRRLLALLGQRGQQAALAIRAAQAQVFVAAVELMELQLHGVPPSLGFAAGTVPRHRKLAGKPDLVSPGTTPQLPCKHRWTKGKRRLTGLDTDLSQLARKPAWAKAFRPVSGLSTR